ncbi:YfhO family protein [Exiguobacterium sp. s157]|uniref:YfhO family protein n=1 Tax=Exiguobacterium sp. s157 TaxID=2751233 RepID=UPI001BECF681|nr:YfhO family protein [Exiguobacterium sp. s157]
MKNVWLIVAALVVSIIAHAFLIYYQSQGGYVAGPNDGLSQMVPFKHFLYETFHKGNLVYAEDFGFGGGTITQLAYYYATSVVFWLTVAVVSLFDVLGLVTPDLELWLQLTLFVSVIRLAAVLLFATYAYRLFHVRTSHAFIGAVLYGVSVIYIRHVTFWEFFADAFLWVPLLVIGLERIIRLGRADLFIAISALMLVNNFYFAYINLVFVFVYVVFRQFIHFPEDRLKRRQQWMFYVGSGVLALLLSAFAFIPATYGFLQNERPSFEHEIDLVRFDNILYDSPLFIIPAVFILFALYRPLYRQTAFRLFATMSLLFTVLHFSPHVGSFFNGFSAPQYRWEYLASFTIGGAVAVGLSHWRFERNAFLTAAIGTIVFYLLFGLFGNVTWPIGLVIFGLMLVSVASLWWKPLLAPYIILASCLIVFNGYTKLVLYDQAIVKTNESFVNSSDYDSAEQRELVALVQDDAAPLERLDWMVPLRNNTPIVQSFLGTSLYSSILNGNLLTLYWRDLEIDMGRESVSRYGSLGNRANLHHLLSSPYWMRHTNVASEAPYGFTLLAESDRYAVYESETRLPFVRTTTSTYRQDALENASMLTREQAMLTGVILEDGDEAPLPAQSINFTMEATDAALEAETLRVTTDDGGIDLIPDIPPTATGDLYVSFDIRKLEGDGFFIKLGGYRTTRKPEASIYRTDLTSMTLRTPMSERIPLRLPEGTYALENVTVEWEDYTTLTNMIQETNQRPDIPFTWDGPDLDFTIEDAEPGTYAVLPVPFERGWRASVNGEARDVLQANYAFSAIQLDQGRNEVELTYRPPFFKITTAMTLLGLVFFISYLVYVRRKEHPFT